jgi:hypothetical protein
MHTLGAGAGFVRHFGACYLGMHHNLAFFVKALRIDNFLAKQGPKETLIYPIDSVLQAKRGNSV